MRETTRFERLALPHREAAFNLAFWLVRSRADAEDVVQEAYLRAYRGFAGFSGGDVRPWLLTIVRNAAYRWVGQRQHRAKVVSLEDAVRERQGEGPREFAFADDQPSVEHRLIRNAELQAVREALGALPPLFREVLVLRELEELSYRDIATVTGVPIGTVMSRLSRARAELRAKLDERTAREGRDAV